MVVRFPVESRVSASTSSRKRPGGRPHLGHLNNAVTRVRALVAQGLDDAETLSYLASVEERLATGELDAAAVAQIEHLADLVDLYERGP